MSSFSIVQNSIRDPYFQLAWEEAIALTMPNFQMKFGVRIWKTRQTIVLGISEKENQTIQKSAIDSFKTNFKSLNDSYTSSSSKNFSSLLIARRCSGGGTVYHDDPGNLNFSLFIDMSDHQELYYIKKSYEVLLGIARDALADQGVVADTAGKSDISVTTQDGILKKVSGNAQFRKKNIIVQHGTLILSKDLFETVEKYQLHPPEEPEYRMKRSHKDFLTSIEQPIDESQFAQGILSRLADYTNVKINKESSKNNSMNFFKHSIAKAYTLRRDKYADLNWILKEK